MWCTPGMNSDISPAAMIPGEEPLVSVVTPVHNGEAFLAECIESVLRQSYQHWEYIIVNNCSTDGTREIAEHYAAQDKRIRVYNQERFVSSMQNHNFGFRSISPECKYCKVAHADDWLFPECLAKMVTLAEVNPSVGVVGAYGLAMDRVVWDGLPLDRAVWDGRLPYPSTVVPGGDICRWHLMGAPYVFGSPTSVLFRADLIRRRDPFYREEYPRWADLDACLEALRESDFGFVHQVLTFTRFHKRSGSWSAVELNAYIVGQLELMKRHGLIHLNPREYQNGLNGILRDYRRFLGQSVFKRPNDREFWKYHREALRELGHPMGRAALIAAAAGAVFEVLSYPVRTVRDVLAGTAGDRQHASLAKSPLSYTNLIKRKPVRTRKR